MVDSDLLFFFTAMLNYGGFYTFGFTGGAVWSNWVGFRFAPAGFLAQMIKTSKHRFRMVILMDINEATGPG